MEKDIKSRIGKFILSIFALVFLFSLQTKAQYFGQNKVRYKNLKFEVYQTPHFELYYYTQNDSLIKNFAKESEAWYALHQQVFRDTFKRPNPVILYSNAPDFQQTTAISGEIGVGTGGVTEGLKNRVVMPLQEINGQTRHVLGHELVHAFQYHSLIEGDSTQLENIGNLPLWMIEGMAEYLSLGKVDANTAMWMRDAVLNDDIPTLEDLDYASISIDHRSAFPFQGGENTALKHLKNYIWEFQQIKTYKETRNELVGVNYSTKFSAWLANGSLSPRIIYQEARKFEQEVIANESTYWVLFELLWRDFFKCVSLKFGDTLFYQSGILDRKYHWKQNPTIIQNWIEGKTEYDFINANMLELKLTGWMSNRGRQNVASYFAKEKEQDWRIGASYFEAMLIDYDVHSNYGNWNYLAGVGNDPRDRKFNIDLQAKNYDSFHVFRNLWLTKNKVEV